MAERVNADGGVTIPKAADDNSALATQGEVRTQAGENGQGLAGANAAEYEAAKSRFEKLRGSAKGGLSTDEIMAITRGED